VLLGIGINFWQTYRSQEAADRPMIASVTLTAGAIRMAPGRRDRQASPAAEADPVEQSARGPED